MSTGSAKILCDMKNDGRQEIPWRARHLTTLRLAQAYKRLNSSKYDKIVTCASYMEFKRFADTSMKLKSANFCQLRLCPTCNWRRSMKTFVHVSRVMSCLENDYNFVFLTLTVRNVSGNVLSKQINSMVAAFKTLCLRKRFKDAVRGWVKCFEVTYNWQTNEYHPHYHVILAVDKEYFNAQYISQNDWCLMWQSCLRVDYKPICDIRVFNESEKGKGKEVAEVAKYTIKASNILVNLRGIDSYSKEIQAEIKQSTDAITDDIVATLDSALANRRLIEYGGIFKHKHKELNLSNDTNSDYADLIHAKNTGSEHCDDYAVECYRWDINSKNYIRI